jgi:hypothetical protein
VVSLGHILSSAARALFATIFHADILLGFLDPEDGGDVPSKRLLTFNGLPGSISRKTRVHRNPARNVQRLHYTPALA